MKFLLRLLVCIPSIALAGAHCEISDFNVEVYDHGGTYIHGNLHSYESGSSNTVPILIGAKSWIALHVSDADVTNRRTSLALAAQMAGRPLKAYFKHLGACSEYESYNSVTGLLIK